MLPGMGKLSQGVSAEMTERPDLRDNSGREIPQLVPLLPWETYPEVLDTFWAVAARAGVDSIGVIEKLPTSFYEYIDTDIHNGFIYFFLL